MFLLNICTANAHFICTYNKVNIFKCVILGVSLSVIKCKLLGFYFCQADRHSVCVCILSNQEKPAPRVFLKVPKGTETSVIHMF
ncbi:hypothetical protein XELAEV_18020975mg [Xenopus laevis]|uniref:Uncharacterized protein n=1 Tax=Xenopus laevis TaxID=8355 RepID=A0A974D8N8_XENLA|nr:hypothetical protein XELAEV_18020975mg [Xenopus laevis]